MRLAVNLNTIHGEPNAELLAPVLAEMDDDLLRQIHLEDSTKSNLIEFDKELSEKLSSFQIPDSLNTEARNKTGFHVCNCPKCGAAHHVKV